MALFIQDDGGMSKSKRSLKALGGCCMPRAIAIVTGCDFDEAWEACAAANAVTKPYQVVGQDKSVYSKIGKRNIDGGTIVAPPFLALMRLAGFTYAEVPQGLWLDCDHPSMQAGRVICTTQDHAFAMIGGVIHDNLDPQGLPSYMRYGIYRYWRFWG